MEQIIALLFLDRTLAHLEHLRTKSFALEIEKFRKTCELSAIQNIIDEIVGLYLSTIYKLRNLS